MLSRQSSDEEPADIQYVTIYMDALRQVVTVTIQGVSNEEESYYVRTFLGSNFL